MFKKSEIFKTRKSTVFSVGGVTSNPQVQSVPANSNCCTSEKEMRTNPSVIPQSTNPFPKNNGIFTECCSEAATIVKDMRFTVNENFTAFGITAPNGNPITVDWGDTNMDNYTATGSEDVLNHTYAVPGTYTVKVYVTGATTFKINACDGIGTDSLITVVAMPNTITNFNVGCNSLLASIDTTILTNCTLFVCVLCNSLTTLDTTPLTSCTEFYCSFCTTLTTLDTTGLTSCVEFYCDSCTSLTTLDTTGLTSCTFFYINNCTSLATLDTTGLLICTSFNCNNCTSIITLNTTPLASCLNLDCGNCTSLTTIDTTPLTSCTAFWCSHCTSLVTLDTTGLTSCTDFNCSNCILDVTNINNALINLDSFGLLNATADLSNQTPPAAPTGAGATAAANLVSNGWNVTTD